jgi:Kef-type K+ transport system membrane component KefB/nucleotide-binding universal stress UspA family protein
MVFAHLLADPLSRFLAQVVVIIVVSRLLGVAMRRIGQPMVIAEISAGILLGPSFFGWLAPETAAALFAPDSLHILQMLAQIGLVLFMFLVGLELDPRQLRGRSHASVAISHTSIIVPFLLGVGVAYYIYPTYADPKVGFTAFALFMGAAMSITAFPVLARILAERRLLHTRIGAITTACAAVDDVTAWCILAFVVAVSRSSGIGGAITTTAVAVGYIAVMFFLVRPILVRMAARVESPDADGVSQNVVAAALVLVFVSSWTTETIGIHALFGAFLLGAVLPKQGGFARSLAGKLEDLVLIVFLPLFFAYSGLRTEIGLVQGAESWLVCGLIILAACTGKFGGSAVAARLTGLNWREASVVGILMNTRGLMELIVLNIGLDLGVISPVVFSMMVMMALFTTFITTSLVKWIYPPELMAAETLEPGDRLATTTPQPTSRPETVTPFRVMACISYEGAGRGLVTMAAALMQSEARARLYAVHLVPATNRGSAFVGEDDPPAGESVLEPALERATELGLETRVVSFVSSDPAQDLCDVAVQRKADLVLLGVHKPLFSQTLLGGVVHDLLSDMAPTVCVFVDRGIREVHRVLVPFQGSGHDRAALGLANRLMLHGGAEVTVLHVVRPRRSSSAPAGAGDLVDAVFAEGAGRVRMKVIEHQWPGEAALAESAAGYDLVVVGVGREWRLGDRRLGIGMQPEPLIHGCPTSLLVVRGPGARPASLASGRLNAN